MKLEGLGRKTTRRFWQQSLEGRAISEWITQQLPKLLRITCFKFAVPFQPCKTHTVRNRLLTGLSTFAILLNVLIPLQSWSASDSESPVVQVSCGMCQTVTVQVGGNATLTFRVTDNVAVASVNATLFSSNDIQIRSLPTPTLSSGNGADGTYMVSFTIDSSFAGSKDTYAVKVSATDTSGNSTPWAVIIGGVKIAESSPAPTPTPEPVASPSPTSSPTPTATPTPTPTSSPSSSVSATPAPSATPASEPVATPSPTTSPSSVTSTSSQSSSVAGTTSTKSSDSENPVVQVSCGMCQTVTSRIGENAILEYRVTDNVGVTKLEAKIYSSNTDSLLLTLPSPDLVSGNSKDGIYRTSLVVPGSFNDDQLTYVLKIGAWDAAGNSTPWAVIVGGIKINAAPVDAPLVDTQKPVIQVNCAFCQSLSAKAGETVRFTFRATDDYGISTVTAALYNKDEQIVLTLPMPTLISGDAKDGTYSVEYTITNELASVTDNYTVRASAVDTSLNRTDYATTFGALAITKSTSITNTPTTSAQTTSNTPSSQQDFQGPNILITCGYCQTVNATVGEKVAFSFRATDNVAIASMRALLYYDPTDSLFLTLPTPARISGTVKDGTYEVTFTVPKTITDFSTTYAVKISALDTSGNPTNGYVIVGAIKPIALVSQSDVTPVAASSPTPEPTSSTTASPEPTSSTTASPEPTPSATPTKESSSPVVVPQKVTPTPSSTFKASVLPSSKETPTSNPSSKNSPSATPSTKSTPIPTSIAKIISITCVRGKLVKQVSGPNAKCPTGFVRK